MFIFAENFEKSFALAGEEKYEAQINLGKNGQGRELIRLYKHPQADAPKKDLMLGQTNVTWQFNSLVNFVPIYFSER